MNINNIFIHLYTKTAPHIDKTNKYTVNLMDNLRKYIAYFIDRYRMYKIITLQLLLTYS